MRKSPYEPIGLASALETEVRDMRAVLRYAQDARRKAEADLADLRERHQRAMKAIRHLAESPNMSHLNYYVEVNAILDAEQEAK